MCSFLRSCIEPRPTLVKGVFEGGGASTIIKFTLQICILEEVTFFFNTTYKCNVYTIRPPPRKLGLDTPLAFVTHISVGLRTTIN